MNINAKRTPCFLAGTLLVVNDHTWIFSHGDQYAMSSPGSDFIIHSKETLIVIDDPSAESMSQRVLTARGIGFCFTSSLHQKTHVLTMIESSAENSSST